MELSGSAVDGLMLRVQVASTAGYVTKKFPKDATFRQVIEKINESLPENVRSARYRMFVNGLRILDDSRTIASQGVKPDVRHFLAFSFHLYIRKNFPFCIAASKSHSKQDPATSGCARVEARNGV